MSTIRSHVSLKSFNTFGLEVYASRYAEIRTEDDLCEVLHKEGPPFFVLGGGSNVLLTRDIDALVLHNAIRGMEVAEEDDREALIRAGGGETWHDLVRWALDRDFGGLENLSLIPGTVGAAPIQNIGAYGVELAEVFEGLEAVELETGELRIFSKEDCGFGYRNSRFKQELKGKFFITQVYLRLSKPPHSLQLTYGAISDTLREMEVTKPTIRDVSEAVMRIRRSKLPDPSELGNSGSFFKNPEVTEKVFQQLQLQFPHLIYFSLPDGRYKIPAGWLIEQCGWKGTRRGDAGCYAKQALVLVNYGNARGREIESLAMDIARSVREKFGIELEPEVNII